MKKVFLLCAVAWPLVALGACTSTTETIHSSGASEATEAATGDSATKTDSGTAADAQDAEVEAATLVLPTDDAGCLTYAAAQEVCGFGSDGTICKFAFGCGATTAADQCQINCEMQSTITCFHTADAQCLVDATKSKSCAALSACKWKL